MQALLGSPTRGDVHPELPRSELFHQGGWGGGSASVEEATFLYALALVLKPHLIIETGFECGWTAAHMGLACKHNGFGCVRSLELDQHAIDVGMANITRLCLDRWVYAVRRSALDGISDLNERSVGLALIDTHIHLRMEEVRAIFPKMEQGGVIAIHDTAIGHPRADGVRLLSELRALSASTMFECSLIHLPSPRGLTLLQLP